MSDLGEKSEDPTPRRSQEARDDGKVARSADLSGAILLLGATIATAFALGWMLDSGRIVIGALLDGSFVGDPLDERSVGEAVRFVGTSAMRIVAPILLSVWAVGFLSHFVQIGWLFAPKALQPSLSKLNPLSGFKRVFGPQGMVKALIDALKVSLVLVVAVFTIRSFLDRILVLPYLTMMECTVVAGRLMLDLALRLLAVLLLLGLIDFAYQRWKRTQDLRMTKQEVKDEMKQTEGDPDVKRRRHRMQQQIAMQRISSAVPQADVIVTNPEHISIAIRYDPDAMAAPRVVAKGADFIALRIRQIATRHGIPIVERKPLARALYRQVAVGQEIPPDFYAAVAEVLAYVYRLGGKVAG